MECRRTGRDTHQFDRRTQVRDRTAGGIFGGSGLQPHTTEITDPITLDDKQLLIQAQKLIDKGKLDPIDQDELERELQEMQGGNRKTVNRLRGLLYLLD